MMTREASAPCFVFPTNRSPNWGRTSRWFCWMTVAMAVGAAGAAPIRAQETVRFGRDIRPILSDTCYACHGPDAQQRQAELRLDQPIGERRTNDGERLVVPRRPEESELLRRITSTDPTLRMPPATAERQLTKEQIETVRRWIAQGGEWEQHWSFVSPSRPAIECREKPQWQQNPIDSLVLQRLRQQNLEPVGEAPRAVLFRRLAFDLTGLPPELEQADAFLVNDQPDSLDRAVDRMLSSPRLGERLAVEWLDAARYADTSGYQNDGPRFMWRWRDWVIDALNRNMPFDQFTVEQLAGDLLPNPTLDTRIATGFNRNHRGNAEGGIIPEEYAVEYVVDRVETTMTVWQGLTIGCARCHEHKFDPISQREFYQLYAYFNSLPEFGRAIKEGNSPPLIVAPTRDNLEELERIDRRLNAARTQATKLEARLRQEQMQWERAALANGIDDWCDPHGRVAHFSFDGKVGLSSGEVTSKTEPGEPVFVPGARGQAVALTDGQFVSADVGDFGYFDAFSFGGFVHPGTTTTGTLFSRMTDARRGDGYAVQLVDGHVQVNLVKRWLDDALRLQSRRKVAPGQWQHLFVTYDGSRGPSGVQLYVNGERWELDVSLDLLNQSFATKEPFRIGAGGGSEGRFRGQFDDVVIYGRQLSAEEVAVLAARPLAEILAVPASQRSTAETNKVRAAYLERHAAADIRAAMMNVRDLEETRARLVKQFPTVMVMQDLPAPRPAFLLSRGQYDKPTDEVSRGTPASLPKLPDDAPANRLGLARWLVSRENPLTARVTVNRYWQMLFGIGIVKTTEDFGSQGDPPRHPELLDWLAVEFMTGGGADPADSRANPLAWDIKRTLRRIVLSATYRQSSATSAEALALDPENRWLARGPRARLTAESIRDQALAASGLLVERLGGPSVKPYQPADLWKELATDNNYEVDRGAGLYRRSMYTYWKRTVSPPTMTTFDAGGRETCQVRRVATNTPLQSLALLNDVTYVETARALAERVLRECGPSTEHRLARAFQLVLGRRPEPHEAAILARSLKRHHERFASDEASAIALVQVGESPPSASVSPAELAAYTAVSSVILNLDEAVTKQ